MVPYFVSFRTYYYISQGFIFLSRGFDGTFVIIFSIEALRNLQRDHKTRTLEFNLDKKQSRSVIKLFCPRLCFGWCSLLYTLDKRVT